MRKDRISQQEELNRRFHEAAGNQNEKLMAELLDKGAQIDAVDKMQRTELTWAAIFMRERTAPFLLSRGANPHHRDSNGDTPLHHVCSEFPMSFQASDWEETALILAKATSIPDLRNNEGLTPFACAIRYYSTAPVVRAIVAGGADLKQKTGPQPLLYSAASRGKSDIVAILLAGGVDADVKNEADGESALSVAARFRHWDTVRLLVQKGADTMARDCNGYRVDIHAREARRDDILDLLQKTRRKIYGALTKKPLRVLPRPKIGK